MKLSVFDLVLSIDESAKRRASLLVSFRRLFAVSFMSGNTDLMSFYVILIIFCKANFYVTCHSSDQDSRGPLAQNGSVEDRGSFHRSSSMYFMLI